MRRCLKQFMGKYWANTFVGIRCLFLWSLFCDEFGFLFWEKRSPVVYLSNARRNIFGFTGHIRRNIFFLFVVYHGCYFESVVPLLFALCDDLHDTIRGKFDSVPFIKERKMQ